MNHTARVTVTLQEPVSLTRRARTDFHQPSHDHVPGSVLRGALAARWLQHRGRPSASGSEFVDVFEAEGSFGPLYAHGTHPIPLSVAHHKYRHEDACEQFWWDRALRALGEKETMHCPKCGQELEHSKGKAKTLPEHTARTRVALDEQGVAEDGNLFVQNALAPGMKLTGWLHGAAVRALHLDDEPITTLLLGAGRSVRGQATLEASTDALPEPVELHDDAVVLRLASPGVFVDRFGFPSDEPDLAEISEVLGVETTEVVHKWTRWTESGGWHLASGLPKPTERAVERGSTFRVQCAEPPSERARRTLMARGLGLRRREGFGALCLPPARPIRLAPRDYVPLRGLKSLPRLLPTLHNRVEDLRNGTADDAWFRNAASQMEDGPREALLKLLEVTDPESFKSILIELEKRT